MPYSCVAQNIRIWSITATEPRFAQAAHIGGTARVLPQVLPLRNVMSLMDVRGIGADRRMRDFRTTGLDTEFDHSNVSEGNEISGSQWGSQQRQARGDTGHGQPLRAARQHIRPCPAPSGDRSEAPPKQRAAVRILLGAQVIMLFSLLGSPLVEFDETVGETR